MLRSIFFSYIVNFYSLVSIGMGGLEAKSSPGMQILAVRASPRHSFFLLLAILWDPGVRILGKNGYFTSLCLIHGTSLFKSSTKSYLDSIFLVRRKVAEVG